MTLSNRILELAIQIQQIPAPTFEEDKRAAFIHHHFTVENLEDVHIDAAGNVLSRMGTKDCVGEITANFSIPTDPKLSETIPERFWLPGQNPQKWKDPWERWLVRGEDHFRAVTLLFLETGEIAEYVLPYLR